MLLAVRQNSTKASVTRRAGSGLLSEIFLSNDTGQNPKTFLVHWVGRIVRIRPRSHAGNKRQIVMGPLRIVSNSTTSLPTVFPNAQPLYLNLTAFFRTLMELECNGPMGEKQRLDVLLVERGL